MVLVVCLVVVMNNNTRCTVRICITMQNVNYNFITEYHRAPPPSSMSFQPKHRPGISIQDETHKPLCQTVLRYCNVSTDNNQVAQEEFCAKLCDFPSNVRNAGRWPSLVETCSSEIHSSLCSPYITAKWHGVHVDWLNKHVRDNCTELH